MAIETITILNALGVQVPVLADKIGATDYAQVLKVGYGADGVLALAEDAAGLPVRLMAGTANVGDVDVASVPGMDRTTDSAAVAQQGGVVMIGNTVYTVTRIPVDTATSGDHTLLAAQGAGKVIRVISFWLVVAGSVTVTFASGAGVTTKLAGAMTLSAGIEKTRDPDGVMNDTAANALLNLNLSAAVQVSGQVKVIVV